MVKVVKESAIVRKIMAAVRQRYPTAYVRKISDRFNRGIPDVLIVFGRKDVQPACHVARAGVLFVETKTKKGVLSEIQRAEHKAIRDVYAVGCDVMVARDVDAVLTTLREMGAV